MESDDPTCRSRDEENRRTGHTDAHCQKDPKHGACRRAEERSEDGAAAKREWLFYVDTGVSGSWFDLDLHLAADTAGRCDTPQQRRPERADVPAGAQYRVDFS